MSTEEDPYRRPEPAPRGALQLGDGPLQFSTSRSERNSGPKGLGGWLIVVAIVLFWALLSLLVSLGFASHQLAALDPGAALRAPLRVRMAADGVLTALNILALVLFFMKSRWFPRVFIAWLALGALAGIVVFVMARQSAGIAPEYAYRFGAAMVSALFYAGIWIAYTIMSDRVKNTFAP
ncbi:MAG: DUF2569 domain-containing protein [Lysobacter sp.]|nr:DUF2569 domain-containing protein [Lysobacter sp.]